MENDEAKQPTVPTWQDFQAADIPVQDMLWQLAAREHATALAGFSVCAGFLSAILHQLRFEKPLTAEEFDKWYNLGRQEVGDACKHLLGNAPAAGDG